MAQRCIITLMFSSCFRCVFRKEEPMNYRMIMQILGIVLGTIAVVLLLPALVCLII